MIQSIKGVLSEFGNIKELVSDNGPCFRSYEFNKFIKTYGIIHVTICPHHHQSNGQVERCIRTIKGLLKKNADPWMSLLIWRLTPVGGDLKSPAELLNGYEHQSNLSLIRKTCTQTSSHKEKLVAKQAKIKDYHDGNAKESKPLCKGQDVLYKLHPDNKRTQWSKDVFLNRSDRSYMVHTETGRKLIRSRVGVTLYKGKIPQPRHVDIEPKVPVRQPVLVNKPNKTSLKVEVSLKKDNSASQVVTRSGWVVKPPKKLEL